MTRIDINDTISDVIVKMSDGNPGAMNVLMEILKPNNIDPDNTMGGLGVILTLDTYGIYGPDIYVLHNDICDRDLTKTLAVIRACQLGYFDPNILSSACAKQDRSGREIIPLDDLYGKVKERLPNFK